MAVVRLSRTFSVSTAHRLHNSELSAEENASIFGKCNRSHGHNYKIKVTLKGKINPVTGMLINISVLKDIAEEAFVDLLDHHDLDRDIPYFVTRPSTVENLVVFVWERMVNAFEAVGLASKLLDEIEIYETESNSVTYRGEYAS